MQKDKVATDINPESSISDFISEDRTLSLGESSSEVLSEQVSVGAKDEKKKTIKMEGIKKDNDGRFIASFELANPSCIEVDGDFKLQMARLCSFSVMEDVHDRDDVHCDRCT